MSFSLKTFHKKFPDESACVDWLIQHRWGDEPICQKCGHVGAYKIKSRNVLKCKACRKQFSVKVGTIFEDSAIPLETWFYAIFLLTTRTKGISSIQLSKDLEVNQKTAWFMLHRIRHAISSNNFDKDQLDGEVEVDETYIGGRRKGKRGRGAEGKTPVVGLLDRDGDAKMKVAESVKRSSLYPVITENVEKGSNIMTDELPSYRTLNQIGYNHESVNHGSGEYVRGNIHTNSVENFFKHFKKGIEAIQIHVSKKHLQRYCDEYVYRFNRREDGDSEKFTSWFSFCESRLTYKMLTS